MAVKKTNTTPRAYLLRGEDDYQKDRGLQELLEQCVPKDFADFDFEEMDAGSVTSDRVVAGLSIPPFAAQQRVVLVKHAHKIEEDQQKKLAESLARTPESGLLILVTPAPDKEDGRVKKGSAVVEELSRAVRKIGQVKDYGTGKGKEKLADATAFAQQLFREAQRTIDPKALQIFVQRVGYDFSTLYSESQKLTAYTLDTGKITEADVLAVTSETPEDTIFALVDAIAERKLSVALKLLSDMFRTGPDPSRQAAIKLVMIARHFRYLQQSRFIKDRGLNSLKKDSLPDSILNLLPANENVTDLVARQYWQERKLMTQASKLSSTQIAFAFRSLALCDLRLKGGDSVEDPVIAMELLVCDLAGGASR